MGAETVVDAGTLRRCDRCGCRLARDNMDDRCAPCSASVADQTALPAAPPANPEVGLRALAAAWGDGFEAFRRAARLEPADAATLAVRVGLVPRRWQLTAAQLTQLSTSRQAASTELARRLGVSRWTVAVWRRQLRLERLSPAARSPRPLRPPRPVEGVTVRLRPRTALATTTGPVRLGRSARTILEALAIAHPAGVTDDMLQAAAFGAIPAERRRAALQATVCRLRRHLPSGTIVREAAGYRLNVLAAAVER
jgi:transposase-like protein